LRLAHVFFLHRSTILPSCPSQKDEGESVEIADLSAVRPPFSVDAAALGAWPVSRVKAEKNTTMHPKESSARVGEKDPAERGGIIFAKPSNCSQV
jgi:hypothetical protein